MGAGIATDHRGFALKEECFPSFASPVARSSISLPAVLLPAMTIPI
jgi:hypothetical protein